MEERWARGPEAKAVRADLDGSRKRGWFGLHNPLPTAPRRIRYEGSRPSLISVRSRTPLGKTRKERAYEVGLSRSSKWQPQHDRHGSQKEGPDTRRALFASLSTEIQRFIDSWARRYSTVRRTFASTSIWFTTVLRAWMTVPWSRPPKAWPIDTRDMPVSWVARYMAT